MVMRERQVKDDKAGKDFQDALQKLKSTLIQDLKDREWILKQVQGKSDQPVPTLTLLYRGSKDGFRPVDFHNKCDNKGPSLTIIKSKAGKVFGGYTRQHWESNE